ncbi:MAG: hypothetical protein J6J70_05840 [Methanocorpusculaceae archaeon]|nr:hypothetical protein [Methanocorpusculaceae archaeon]
MKKVMKKVLILSLALMILMVGAVSAGDVLTQPAQSGSSGITTISYGVTEGYSLSIPASFSFNTEGTVVTSKVEATGVSLRTDMVLNVTVSSDHQWRLMEHELVNDKQELVNGGGELDYTLSFTFDNTLEEYSYARGEYMHIPVLLIEAGNPSGETELTFTLTDTTHAKAAHYQDKLNFAASIQSVSGGGN